MTDLVGMKCVEGRGDEPPFTDAEIATYQPFIPEWKIVERDNIKRLERAFRFKNFAQAVAFTNKVAEIAEQEEHHPAILTEWGKVTVTWWTHKIKGLHRNDFIMAAKSDRVASDA